MVHGTARKLAVVSTYATPPPPPPPLLACFFSFEEGGGGGGVGAVQGVLGFKGSGCSRNRNPCWVAERKPVTAG